MNILKITKCNFSCKQLLAATSELWEFGCKLVREVVACPCLHMLKNSTGSDLEVGSDFKVDPALSRGLEQMTSRDPFQPGLFYDSEYA